MKNFGNIKHVIYLEKIASIFIVVPQEPVLLKDHIKYSE